MADGVIVKGIYVRVGEEGIWDVERTAWENPFDLTALPQFRTPPFVHLKGSIRFLDRPRPDQTDLGVAGSFSFQFEMWSALCCVKAFSVFSRALGALLPAPNTA